MTLNDENWRTTDLNVDSLWIIDKRDSSGKHENNYHGNFVPQIPNQLIRRYTKKEETVLELFAGSGTTLYECERLGRNYIGFDINQQMIDIINQKMSDNNKIHFTVNNCDVVNGEKMDSVIQHQLLWSDKKKADFLIAHPPYLDIVKFTDRPEDLSQISDLNIFIDKFTAAMSNGLRYLEKERYFAVVAGDIYKKSEVIPLGFYLMYAIKKAFNVKMKGIIVKNIEGNRGKLGSQGIWKYRALNSDYYLFKHEYIFVFKKNF
ncbi:MAG: class I SAM-dependent methyltransferase [Bacteroidales bacterium]|nr:class I SAM-dependent methyltransferase [Bacteroidales bacterium]